MRNVDVLDLTILSDLNKAGHISKVSGAPLTAFHIKRSPNALYKRLIFLEKLGYVAHGLSLVKADTFFITPEGMKLLKETTQ